MLVFYLQYGYLFLDLVRKKIEEKKDEGLIVEVEFLYKVVVFLESFYKVFDFFFNLKDFFCFFYFKFFMKDIY